MNSAVAAAQTLGELMVVGGWAMWPLGACLTGTLFLLSYLGLRLRAGQFVAPGAAAAASEHLAAGRLLEAAAALEAVPTVLGRAVAGPLRSYAGDPAALEQAVSAELEATEAGLQRWVQYLSALAGIAPMLGLLGTVSGMIGAFQTLSEGALGQAEALAGDIGEALVTTAAGLIVAIPAMAGWYVLRHLLEVRMTAAVRAANRLLARFPAPVEE